MFRYGLDGLVVGNLAVMGASVSTNPFNVVWQLLWVFYGLTAAAAVGLVTAILVVLPVLDARAAAKVSTTCGHSEHVARACGFSTLRGVVVSKSRGAA